MVESAQLGVEDVLEVHSMGLCGDLRVDLKC